MAGGTTAGKPGEYPVGAASRRELLLYGLKHSSLVLPRARGGTPLPRLDLSRLVCLLQHRWAVFLA